MRKFLIGLLLIIAASSAASAQSNNYFGASTGLPLTLNVHYGFADMFGPDMDLRILGRLHFGGGFGLSAAGDFIYHFRDAAQLSAPYAGGGAGLGIFGASGASAFMWDIHGLAGYQHRINQDWSVFGELNLGLGVVGVAVAGASASAVGVTYAVRLGGSYFF